MSQSRRSNPKYRHYQPKNLGVVRIDRKDHYLGRYDSPESWEKYHRLVAEWLSRGQTVGLDAAASTKPNDSISINEMLLAYWQFAEAYYSKDGVPTKELENMKDAIWPLRQLYGMTKAVEFGPQSLKAVRQHMISEQKLCRNVDVAAMIQVERLTGMRPDDVVSMRPCDIDQSGDVWIYERRDHTNRWRGHRRLVPLGPKAQAVLKPFMDRAPEAFLFSPKESEAWRLEHRPAYHEKERKTKVYPCELPTRSKRRGKTVASWSRPTTTSTPP